MSYLFLYNHKSGSKWGPSDSPSYFNFEMLDQITVNYEYHYLSYHNVDTPGAGHYLHHIARVALDNDLLACGILAVDDDYEAMTLRFQHDNFMVNDLNLIAVYENPNFEEILADCPIVKSYADRGATRKADSKYVTKVANAVHEVAFSVSKLNGALGDDFEEQFGELAYLCNSRIAEYKETSRKNSAALTKERKLIRKRLEVFKAKDL